jgi:hypothetical protein
MDYFKQQMDAIEKTCEVRPHENGYAYFRTDGTFWRKLEAKEISRYLKQQKAH